MVGLWNSWKTLEILGKIRNTYLLCYCGIGKDVDCPVAPLVIAVAVLLPPGQVGDAAVVGEAEPGRGRK